MLTVPTVEAEESNRRLEAENGQLWARIDRYKDRERGSRRVLVQA